MKLKLTKRKKRVAVIFGGISPEHGISVKSAEFFISSLSGSDFLPLPVYISRGGAWKLYPVGASPSKIERGEAVGVSTYPVRLGCKSGFLTPLRVIPVSAAIPLLHGEGGEDGAVQGALSSAGIAYLGADTVASAICYDKAYTKTVAESLGVPTVPWIYLNKPPFTERSVVEEVGRQLSYPVFVKPATLGSSIGCLLVKEEKELVPAIISAGALSGGRVIIEKLVDSPRELEVAYFSTEGKEIFTNPGEIHCDSGFYSFEEKYSEKSRAAVTESSDIPSEVADEILRYSRALVGAIGISHMCRIDFFYSGGAVYFNEINTIPGMTESSLYPRLLSLFGVSPREMASELTLAAIGGYDRRI